MILNFDPPYSRYFYEYSKNFLRDFIWFSFIVLPFAISLSFLSGKFSSQRTFSCLKKFCDFLVRKKFVASLSSFSHSSVINAFVSFESSEWNCSCDLRNCFGYSFSLFEWRKEKESNQERERKKAKTREKEREKAVKKERNEREKGRKWSEQQCVKEERDVI